MTAHLSDDDILELKQRLALMKKEALEEIETANADIETGHRARDKDVGSLSDEVEATRLGEVRMAEIDIDRSILRMVDAAEDRLADGTYGMCIDCGDPISRERLMALPTAIRCAACQEQFEQKERR